jgi:hypothetical protein
MREDYRMAELTEQIVFLANPEVRDEVQTIRDGVKAETGLKISQGAAMRLAIKRQAERYGSKMLLKTPDDQDVAAEIVRQAFPTGLGAGLMELASKEGLTMRQVALRAVEKELRQAGIELIEDIEDQA